MSKYPVVGIVCKPNIELALRTKIILKKRIHKLFWRIRGY